MTSCWSWLPALACRTPIPGRGGRHPQDHVFPEKKQTPLKLKRDYPTPQDAENPLLERFDGGKANCTSPLASEDRNRAVIRLWSMPLHRPRCSSNDPVTDPR